MPHEAVRAIRTEIGGPTPVLLPPRGAEQEIARCLVAVPIGFLSRLDVGLDVLCDARHVAAAVNASRKPQGGMVELLFDGVWHKAFGFLEALPSPDAPRPVRGPCPQARPIQLAQIEQFTGLMDAIAANRRVMVVAQPVVGAQPRLLEDAGDVRQLDAIEEVPMVIRVKGEPAYSGSCCRHGGCQAFFVTAL